MNIDYFEDLLSENELITNDLSNLRRLYHLRSIGREKDNYDDAEFFEGDDCSIGPRIEFCLDIVGSRLGYMSNCLEALKLSEAKG